MKKIVFFSWLLLVVTTAAFAQLTVAPEGGNRKAMVGERIGITDVTIHYNRPGVKGREGKIWGQLVYAGFTDLQFGSSKSSPWRAGANENTTIEFSTDVMIEGKPLPAGKYGFFIAYDPDNCTVIFSKNNTSWGSFFYDEKEDALRVNVKPVKQDKSVEWLKYEFINQQDNSATIALQWENLLIPVKIEVDLDRLQLQSFRDELRGEKSFIPGWQSYNQAARYTLERNVNLEEGLKWADQAISGVFIGNANFITLSTKAEILERLGRKAEADSIMKKALPLATMLQLHQYGRQLVAMKKPAEALAVFEQNHKQNPKQFTTLVGLMRGHSANKDYKKALKYANEALPLAPDELNKNYLKGLIEKLAAGKGVE